MARNANQVGKTAPGIGGAAVHAAKKVNTKLEVPMEKVQERLGCGKEAAVKTVAATTQLGMRHGQLPIKRRYKPMHNQLRYRRLRTTLYTDTWFSKRKSVWGNTCQQLFVDGGAGLNHLYSMKKESQGPDGLVDFIKTRGIPAQIHSDNAKMETGTKWGEIVNEFWIKQTTTEPYSPWQNDAER